MRNFVINDKSSAKRSIQSDQEQRLVVYCRIMAGFALLLLAVTWRLWTPQIVFPQIPFFEFLVSTPSTVDWVACAIVLVSLLGMLFSN